MKPEDYTWGLGLEHELHLFHIPKNVLLMILKRKR